MINKDVFVRCDTPDINLDDYPNFIYEETDGEWWMKWKDYYCLFQYDENVNVLWNSTVCVGKSDIGLLTVAVNTLNKLFDEGYTRQAMGWQSGYKSELIIRRVARHFDIIAHDDEYIVFEKGSERLG